MACANVFRVGGIGTSAQGVRELEALLRREREILADVPGVGFWPATPSRRGLSDEV